MPSRFFAVNMRIATHLNGARNDLVRAIHEYTFSSSVKYAVESLINPTNKLILPNL